MSRKRFLATKLPVGLVHRSRRIAYGLLVLAAANCGSVVGGAYTIKWTFINQGTGSATFGYADSDPGDRHEVTVPQGSTGGGTTEGEVILGATNTELLVSVSFTGPPAGFVGIISQDVPVSPDETTPVTVTWNGTDLAISSGSPCPPASRAGSLRAAAPTEPSVAACAAPTTWKLDGITGNASGSWSDLAGSASGTLTASFPPEVKEGETYQLSATFSGTLTYNPGWEMTQRNIDVSICDRSGLSNVCGLAATSAQQLARGAASGSITWTGPWTVTSSFRSLTTFTLEAAGGFSIQGTSPLLVATYSKVP